MSKPAPRPDSKKALLDAFDHVVKAQQEQTEQERLARRRAGRPAVMRWVLMFVVLLTAAYLWLERPQWMFPVPPPPESATVREASLRIALANAARHIEHFHRAKGRLPTHLDETGTLGTGIVYERLNAGAYRLRGASGPINLTLRSSDSLRPFVGKSFEILSRRSR